MKQDLRNYLFITVIAILFFIPYLGKVHLFDWDEINFAEAAREMIVTNDYLRVRVDYEPFHEKPPFFIWMQVASMKAFGINEFAARLPNAIIGIITLLFLYAIGKENYNEKFGLMWVLIYLGSFLPHFYFKSGIIDPTFNLFMFSGVFFLSKYYLNKSYNKKYLSNLLIGAVLTSFAVLTKGPVGYLLVFMAWFILWIINYKRYRFPLLDMLIFTVISFIPLIIWYSLVLKEAEGSIIIDFIKYQIRLLTTGDAGHKGPFFYHFVIIMLGCFPATAFVFRGFKKNILDNETQKLFRNWNIILLSVVLIIFSIVKTKIIHYSSLAYFPVTYLAAHTLYYIIYHQLKWRRYFTVLLLTFGMVLSLSFSVFPIVMKNIDSFLPKIKDEFTKAILQTNVNWEYFDAVPGILYFISLLIILILILNRKYLQSVVFTFGATSIMLFVILNILAPKIEPYTQGSPIEFYKSMQGKDVYVEALGYKSYAHLFYSKKRPENSQYLNNKIPNNIKFDKWLLEGEIDKNAYFVTKLNKAEKYKLRYNVIELYRKNGFVFLMREKIKGDK